MARTSDPRSSHVANAAIARNVGLRAHILAAAEALSPVPFDDWDLLELVEDATGKRQQRNVIARTRGLMERDGLVVGIGLRRRRAGDRETLHFVLPRDVPRDTLFD